jgi:hypothetical protein
MHADTETARRAIESCAKVLGYRPSQDERAHSYTVNGRTFHLGEIVRPAACTNPEAMLIVVWFCHFRQACYVKPSDGGRYVGPGLTKIPCDDLLKL